MSQANGAVAGEKRKPVDGLEGSSSTKSAPASSSDKLARRKRFEDVFPTIATELIDYVKGEGMPEDAVEWYHKVSQSSQPTF